MLVSRFTLQWGLTHAGGSGIQGQKVEHHWYSGITHSSQKLNESGIEMNLADWLTMHSGLAWGTMAPWENLYFSAPLPTTRLVALLQAGVQSTVQEGGEATWCPRQVDGQALLLLLPMLPDSAAPEQWLEVSSGLGITPAWGRDQPRCAGGRALMRAWRGGGGWSPDHGALGSRPHCPTLRPRSECFSDPTQLRPCFHSPTASWTHWFLHTPMFMGARKPIFRANWFYRGFSHNECVISGEAIHLL